MKTATHLAFRLEKRLEPSFVPLEERAEQRGGQGGELL